MKNHTFDNLDNVHYTYILYTDLITTTGFDRTDSIFYHLSEFTIGLLLKKCYLYLRFQYIYFPFFTVTSSIYSDLLNMRNHREIPVNKVQITDQILDAAYDLGMCKLNTSNKKMY